MRHRAARALARAGHVGEAESLEALPPLTDDLVLDEALRAIGDALRRVLHRTTADDVLLALFAAGEAVAMARAPEPQPVQMRELVQALQVTA